MGAIKFCKGRPGNSAARFEEVDRVRERGRLWPGSRNRLRCVVLLAALVVSLGAAETERVPASLPGAAPFEASLRATLESALAARGDSYRPRSKQLRADGSPRFTNRLLLEASPYLQQHAHNPVNWYPWGDAAFEAARRLSRPVFVSIGYATCHWCHVMEEETFDDPAVATLLNEHFIAIKVDREARPDVDAIYMAALHAMGENGGWPLNVWVTPDGNPFFGGTYFPPVARSGRPAFKEVLARIHKTYSERPSQVQQTAIALTAALRAQLEGGVAEQSRVPGESALKEALAHYGKFADRVWGGVGSKTKFPSSLPIRLLLREHRRTGSQEPLDLSLLTLDKMRVGGLHDQLGGGFHRYSTDRRWLVPHFEKMLYDNALIALALLDSGLAAKREVDLQTARSTLDYLLREMQAPGGGFYSATDADSLDPHGELEEGRYFTWTPAEIEAALEPDLAAAAIAWYGVTPGGQLDGRNILHTWREPAAVAASLQIDEATLRARLERARPGLLAARSLRPAPLRDEKILSAWNGLAISALARAGFVLKEPRYLAAARRAADHVLTKMKSDGRLRRVYYEGRASGPAFLEDYAFVEAALLDLYETDFDSRWLREAVALQDVLDAHYLDAAGGGYFKTADDAEVLLAREKPARDGAIPSGNSLAAANLLRLGSLTGDSRYLDQLNMIYAAFYDAIARRPASFSELLLTRSDELAQMREVVVVAPEQGGDLEPMLAPLRGIWTPNHVLVVVREGEELESLQKLVPPVGGKRAIAGKVTAYVCENRVCRYPTSSPAALRKQLLAATQPGTTP